MTYGERLQLAIDERAKALRRKISNTEVGDAGELSRQNVGLILKGTQKPNIDSHYKLAAFLKVDHYWLATGEGDMFTGVAAGGHLVSDDAKQLDLILKNIPPERYTKAFQGATQLLISHLSPTPLTQPASDTIEAPAPSVPVAKPSEVPHK